MITRLNKQSFTLNKYRYMTTLKSIKIYPISDRHLEFYPKERRLTETLLNTYVI